MSGFRTICPSCGGAGENLVFINRGPDTRTHSADMRPCRRCWGRGWVTDADLSRIKRGAAMRDERTKRGETLKAAADRLGLTPAQLSARENGL